METFETAVIGAGQAGLAMSHHLTALGCEHVVLERARVAERWRTERWDSLMFQFPNWSIELPGRSYSSGDPEGFARKDEVLHFIEDYCEWIKAPIRSGVNVTALRSTPSAGRYEIASDAGRFSVRNVVIATGPYQRSRLPPCHRGLPSRIVQVHARDYRNPGVLPDGAVLVVGSGASGCQIADELLQSGRRVYLSIGRHRRVPRRYRGKDVFWWRRELGELDQSVDTTPAVRRMPAPLVTGVNGGYDIDLRNAADKGMTLMGHLLDICDGTIAFATDVENNLRAGDQTLLEFESAVDAWVQTHGMDLPEPPSTLAGERRSVDSDDRLDCNAAQVVAVIWATGYEFEFGWVELPVFDSRGVPVQYRGTTALPGIYFLGMPWMHKAKSSFLYGVGEDAAYVAACIARERKHRARRR
jgi:putative flavoprotein involved in K+ transport